MSLLMDALRKAELEKKKAAERLEETIEQAQTLDGNETVETPQQPEADGDVSSEHQITRLDRTHVRSKEEIFAATAQLSLEPIEKVIRHRQEDSEDLDKATQALAEDLPDGESTNNPPADNQEVDVGETLAFPQLELPDETQEREVEQAAETDSPVDTSVNDEANQTAEHAIPGIYDETLQGEPFRPESERPYDETLPGVSAAELARDLGEENQPTPVAAQTVFTAAATAQPSFRYKWPLIIGLILIVMIAGSIIIYQSVTPLVNQIPAQQLTGDLKLQPPVQAPPSGTAGTATPPAPATAASPAAAAPQSAPASTETTAAAGAAAPDKAAAPATPPPQTAGTAAPPPPTAGTATPPAPATAASPAATTPQGTAAGTETTAAAGAAAPAKAPAGSGQGLPAPLPAQAAATAGGEAALLPGEPEPALLKISRSKGVDKRLLVLNEAYAAFQKGDMDKARKLYETAGKTFPENRDVLLGLGAIAMKEGNTDKVYDIYSRLYKLNPRDPIARAVLLSLDRNTDPVRRESTLKLMLDDFPDDAFLHFSLGTLYASQSRWSEAQQAFFDAYRNDSVNPDYALNLAISLDHLGQYKTALDYYTTALKLADGQSSTFNRDAVRARIKTLAAVRKQN